MEEENKESRDWKDIVFLTVIILILVVALGLYVSKYIDTREDLDIQKNKTIEICNVANSIADFSNYQSEFIENMINRSSFGRLNHVNCSIFV